MLSNISNCLIEVVVVAVAVVIIIDLEQQIDFLPNDPMEKKRFAMPSPSRRIESTFDLYSDQLRQVTTGLWGVTPT